MMKQRNQIFICRKLIKNILVICILSVISSCGIYRQNVVNAPLFEKKGQTQISVHKSFTGYEGQAAYALTKDFALIANYSDQGTQRIDYSAINFEINKHYFGELGGGYYQKNEKGKCFDLFFILGNGMTSRFWSGLTGPDSSRKLTTTFQQVFYNRFCVQSDFGSKINKVDFIFSPRIFVLNYHNIEDNSTDKYRYVPNTYVYADANFTLRYSFAEWLKLSAQMNCTLPLTGNGSFYYESSALNFSLGSVINFNLKK